jgi:methyl-accepting chemotaxis protein
MNVGRGFSATVSFPERKSPKRMQIPRIVLSLFSLMAAVALVRLDDLSEQNNLIHRGLDTMIQAPRSTSPADLRASMDRIRDELNKPQSSDNSLMIGLWLAGLGSGFAFCWLATRRLFTPLRQAAATISHITQGEGNLNQPLDPTRPGELGELANCFNQLTEKIRDLIRQTARSTESVIEAMTEMTACIHDVARNATTANEATNVAHRETQNGCSLVQQTADTIREGAKEVAIAEHSIQAVESESQRIGGVLASRNRPTCWP